MKKLISAVAAVAFGVVANAATCSWTAMEVNPLASGATILSAYGFDTSALTQDAFLALYAAGDTSWQTAGTAGLYDTGMAMGEIAGYANGGAVNIWTAFFDDQGNVLVSATESTTMGGAGQDPMPFLDTTAASALGIFDASVAGAFTANGAGWYAIPPEPTPEPTSGLLLLLGLSGLALRRRRA